MKLFLAKILKNLLYKKEIEEKTEEGRELKTRDKIPLNTTANKNEDENEGEIKAPAEKRRKRWRKEK